MKRSLTLDEAQALASRGVLITLEPSPDTILLPDLFAPPVVPALFYELTDIYPSDIQPGSPPKNPDPASPDAPSAPSD